MHPILQQFFALKEKNPSVVLVPGMTHTEVFEYMNHPDHGLAGFFNDVVDTAKTDVLAQPFANVITSILTTVQLCLFQTVLRDIGVPKIEPFAHCLQACYNEAENTYDGGTRSCTHTIHTFTEEENAAYLAGVAPFLAEMPWLRSDRAKRMFYSVNK